MSPVETNRPDRESAALELIEVGVRYSRDAPWALDDVSLSFAPGSHTAVLGPNGAGKSTLLRLLGGLRSADRGVVRIEGRDAVAWDRRDLSRRLALVSPVEEQSFPLLLEEYVGLGRSPYLGRFEAPGPGDRAAVHRALAAADLAALSGRRLDQLSAGEVQRARVARALAQEPAILLLDEPTAHLDLGHAMAAFEIIRQIQCEQFVTVVSVTHSINMASRFSDRVAMLARGRIAADGPPDEVLTSARLSEVFGHPVAVESVDGLGRVAVPMGEAGPAQGVVQ